MYSPTPLYSTDPADVAAYVQQELQTLAQALSSISVPHITFAELHVAPAKPRDFMVVAADGTDWDPGAGKGLYVYYSGAWNKAA